MTEKTFLSKDGKSTVHYYVWEPEGQPVAVLQLVHGMAEHISRYAPLAEYLNQYGVLVCGNDHIGHGNSAKPEDWGYFGEENGWKYMVLFEMTEEYVRHIQMPKQFKRAQALGWLAMLAGRSTGKPAMAALGLDISARNTSTSEFKNVEVIKPRRRRNTIYVNQRLDRNQVYAEDADFDFVERFIMDHCTRAKVK